MIIAYNDDGSMHSLNGFHVDYTTEMIDELPLFEGYRNLRIYDSETIERVWRAMDTGGTVSVGLDDDGNVLGVITVNGEFEPPEDVPREPTPSEFELLQEYVVEVDFRVAMIELGF